MTISPQTISDTVVVPIPPSYSADGNLCFDSTKRYLDFLQAGGVQTIMTTAGTAQYNLLSPEEVHDFNICCATHFSGYHILGLPPAANRFVQDEIQRLNDEKLENTTLMLMYPDRYYGGEEITESLTALADGSAYPVFIHGMFMRKGTGGTYDFDAEVVNVLAQHPNIIGMKEESTSLDVGFKLCHGLNDPSFITVVAGGSQRRFMHLGAVGAHTFLAGLENIFPGADTSFLKAYKRGELDVCRRSIQEFEAPFFDVFMSIGWHAALHESLSYLGFTHGVRLPFPKLTSSQRDSVHAVIEQLKDRLSCD